LVDWHDRIVATLGRAVDPRNPDTIKPSVAVIDLSQNASYSGIGEADFTVHFSQHAFDLTRHFQLNASLSAKYGAYSGRVNFGMVDDTSYSGKTLNFVFVLASERLEIYDEVETNKNYQEFRLLSLDSSFVVARRSSGQVVRYEILRK